jgi:hypothetical protein
MQFLIDFAAEDSEFQAIVRRASEFDTVQGVVLEVDRFWLSLWRLRERWGEDRMERWAYRYLDAIYGPSRLPWDLEIPEDTGVFSRPLDISDVEGWLPEIWRHRQNWCGLPTKGPPLVVKVCLRPLMTAEERAPTLEQLYDREGRLSVELETRPRAQLSSNPRKAQTPLSGGVSIGVGATDYGTLGVILRDDAGGHFGLTCSHVTGAATHVLQPSKRDSSSATTIGEVVAATSLATCPAGMKCNPWSGVTPNEIDVSLIDLGNGVSAALEVLDIGPLTGVMPRASISPSQAVEVMARTSRRNRLQVGGLAAWYSFAHDGADYCFKNLFEVQSPYGTPGVIKRGDSGAPVCSPDGQGTAWAGMIVGCDAFKGYAMYSETVQSWLLSEGYTLSVA